MDFIERLFAIAPDRGTGLFEVLLILAPLMATLLWRWRKWQNRTQGSGVLDAPSNRYPASAGVCYPDGVVRPGLLKA